MRYYATLGNLGPYAASLFLHAELAQSLSRIHTSYLENLQLMNDDTSIISARMMTSKMPPASYWEIRDIHVGFKEFFPDLNSHCSIPTPVPMSWCAPKIQSLVEILLAHHTPAFQGIVFVEQRQVAACLASILPRLPELNGIIRAASLVGQGVGNDGIAKSTPGAHSDAVKLFRKGEINLCQFNLVNGILSG